MKNTYQKTSAFATPPTQEMFQSRPFVVQTQRENSIQQPDFNISLTQAEHYGHNLSKIYTTNNQATTGISSRTAVQPKTSIQSAISNQSIKGQTMSGSVNSKPIQMVYGKDERLRAKEFNQQKRQEIQEIQNQNKKPQTIKDLKNKKKGRGQNPATDKFAKDHVASSSTSMSSDSTRVGNNRMWGNRDSGRSTLVSMSDQDQTDEQRYALEGRKMTDTNFRETGSTAPKMGVNKPTKFSYPNQTSVVTSDRQGNRQVAKGKQEFGQPILGMRGNQIHHLHGVQNEEQ
jgi:hypothetical protein